MRKKSNLLGYDKKHFAIFLPSLHDGGAEKMMVNLSRGMAGRGYQIDLVLAKAEGPHLDAVSNMVNVVDLKANRVLGSFINLVRYLRNARPYAVLSVMNHANIIAILAKYFSGVSSRIIISERNTLSISARHGLTLRARLMPWLIKIIYPLADGIVAVSRGVADDLHTWLRGLSLPVDVIYNPVVTQELVNKTQVPFAHTWFGAEQPPVILGVGRFREQKDFSTLIRAFANVRSKRHARLMILGEGPERPKLEALVQEFDLMSDVALPGFVENPYVYMSQASVFVLSSKWEGLPAVLIEAMYCGAKLVSTDCPSGAREILDNGRFGQLVPVGDDVEMARAIERALDEKVSRPSRDGWVPFEMEKVVDQYLNLLLGNTNA